MEKEVGAGLGEGTAARDDAGPGAMLLLRSARCACLWFGCACVENVVIECVLCIYRRT